MSNIALDAKMFARQFRAFLAIADVLEKIGNVEKYKIEAEGLKAKAVEELLVVKKHVATEKANLYKVVDALEETKNKLADRKVLDQHVADELLSEAKKDAAHIVSEAKKEAKMLLVVSLSEKQALIESNGKMMKENSALESKISKLNKEFVEMKKRLG